MSTQVIFNGIDSTALDKALANGIDHGGNPITPFVDDNGGWPLRCCMRNSRRGDRIAIIAWSPFDWDGPYRETGPIVVHTDGCEHAADLSVLPDELNRRPMTLRPYGRKHTILYDLVTHVPAAGDLSAEVRTLFANDDVAEVYARNVTGGCFAFVATRAAVAPT